MIPAFNSLLEILVAIAISAAKIKNCVITAGIEKYRSIIKINREKHDQIVFLRKSKLSFLEVLISKSLIHPYISHDDFVSVNNALSEYNVTMEKIKNPETSEEFTNIFC